MVEVLEQCCETRCLLCLCDGMLMESRETVVEASLPKVEVRSGREKAEGLGEGGRERERERERERKRERKREREREGGRSESIISTVIMKVMGGSILIVPSTDTCTTYHHSLDIIIFGSPSYFYSILPVHALSIPGVRPHPPTVWRT